MMKQRGKEVATMTGNSEKEALENWNAEQLPGNRLNGFYLKFTEVK